MCKVSNPLWRYVVAALQARMSALGHKQTFAVQTAMSALLPKADMCGATRDFRFGPIADNASRLSGQNSQSARAASSMFSADRIRDTTSCGAGSIDTVIGFSAGPGSSSASNWLRSKLSGIKCS
jgi:hypothetical protein